MGGASDYAGAGFRNALAGASDRVPCGSRGVLRSFQLRQCLWNRRLAVDNAQRFADAGQRCQYGSDHLCHVAARDAARSVAACTDITRMRVHPPLRATAIASCMALLKHPGMWRSKMPASIPRSRHI
ncbi:hypotehtical protein [Xanthomonas oryzae pv. oryzae MAFF 311018]|nr:hypotehtical protein [Xanthomonas oryzae pv. oryzae MAFF 311018]